MLFSEILQKIQHAKMLDFGQVFNDSIELFKKVWLQGLIMILIVIAFVIPFMLIVYLPLIVLGIADASDPGAYDGLAPLAAIFMLIAYLLFLFFMIVISFGLKAALYRIMRQKEINSVAKDDYFFFLRKPYFGKTIKLSLAYFGISLIATLLCVFPLIYVMVPLSILPVVYAFNPELSDSNLIKVSFELGNKKWLIAFGLTLIAGFLAQIVGMLMCGIGIFVTASFAAIPVYFIYKEVIGFQDNNEINIKVIGEKEIG
ncbi:hypothetical protein [Psychroserpens sp. MEBiC05023]